RHFFFGIGEVQPVDLFGAPERLLADARGRRAAALRIDGCGDGDCAGERGRNCLEKATTANACDAGRHEGSEKWASNIGPAEAGHYRYWVRLKPDTTDRSEAGHYR